MFFHYLFLLIFMLGLLAGIASFYSWIRACRYYVEPQGLSLWRRGLAKFSSANYAADGAARVRVAFFSLLLCAYAWVPGGVIHWARFGSVW